MFEENFEEGYIYCANYPKCKEKVKWTLARTGLCSKCQIKLDEEMNK